MKRNLGVIFGGKSVEHEISIISAVEAMASVDKNKYKVIPIYIDKNNTWYTGGHLKDIIHYRDMKVLKRYAKKVVLVKKGNSAVLQRQGLIKRNICVLDMILPIGHGAYLEDGSLQGYLNMIGIPYAGSNVLGSAIGQDKVIQKDLLRQNGIPVCNYIWFYDWEFEKNKKDVMNKIKTLNYPMYVKPSSLGSSIGISLIKSEKELEAAVKEASKYDRKIIIEEQVDNVKEANISVLGNYEKAQVSEIEEINLQGEFYSFKEKYVEGYTKTLGRAKKKTKKLISKEMMEDMKKYALETFKLINASGVARIDFLIDDKTKRLFVNEINTIPGDLASFLWMAKKESPTELIDHLLDLALAEQEKRYNTIYAFDRNLLEKHDLGGNKIKKKEPVKKNVKKSSSKNKTTKSAKTKSKKEK